MNVSASIVRAAIARDSRLQRPMLAAPDPIEGAESTAALSPEDRATTSIIPGPGPRPTITPSNAPRALPNDIADQYAIAPGDIVVVRNPTMLVAVSIDIGGLGTNFTNDGTIWYEHASFGGGLLRDGTDSIVDNRLDYIYGTSASSELTAGQNFNSPRSLIKGNDGDERIELGDYTFQAVHGGEGTNTLVLPTDARDIDLGAVLASGRVSGFEIIRLNGFKRLLVDAATARDFIGTGAPLRIIGHDTDTVLREGAWTQSGTVTLDGVSYERWLTGSTEMLVAPAVVVALASGRSRTTEKSSSIRCPVPPSASICHRPSSPPV